MQEKAVATKDYVAGSVVPTVQEKAVAAKDFVAGSVVPAMQEKAVAAKDYVVETSRSAGAALQSNFTTTTTKYYCAVLECWTYAPCILHGPGAPFEDEMSRVHVDITPAKNDASFEASKKFSSSEAVGSAKIITNRSSGLSSEVDGLARG